MPRADRPRAYLACGLLAVALGTIAAPARGQTTSATIKGAVRAASGEAAEHAVVQARSEATGAQRTAITDHRGRFEIPALEPGEWMVVARDADGTLSEPRVVALGLQSTVSLELVLGGGLTEEVTVRAPPQRLVDPRRTGEELRVGRREVAALPIVGRSVTDLALLDSSVLAPQPGTLFGERDAVFHVNGQSGRSNSFLVDGMDNNDLTSGTTLNAFLSQQVIREFVVMTNQFAPEFGRASGGVLNIITERGTNEPDFEVFVQGANRSLNTAGPLVSGLPRPDGLTDVTTRLQTGFKYGGPLRKDRSFLFVAYEHQEIDEVLPFTGLTRDRIEGGWMIAPNKDDNLFVRTDFNLTDTNFLMLRVSGDDRVTGGLNVGGRMTPEAGYLVEEQDWQVAASWTRIVADGLINEARLLVGDSTFNQVANSDRPGVDRLSGVFGGSQLNFQRRDEDRIQLIDNITWQRGAHTWKAGLDIAKSHTAIGTRFNPSGTFLYETDLSFEPGDCGDLVVNDVRAALDRRRMQDPDATIDDIKFEPLRCDGQTGVDDDGDGIVDEPGLIGTYPFAYLLVDSQPSATLDDTQVGLFFQDSWQATRRWLFDYGLRYDLNTYELPDDAGVDSLIPNGGAGRDTDNVSPRFSFSFVPDTAARWVIRGGAGVFHDKIVLGFPAVASITSGTEIGLIFPQGFTFEFTEDIVEQFGIDAIKDDLIFPGEFVLRFSTGTTLDTPYTVQYNAGFERNLGERAAVRFNVTRTLGYHQVLLKDLNPPVKDPTTGIPEHPRDPDVGSIAAFVTEGRSWYWAAEMGWGWRGNGRSLSASYTLSRAEDMGFDPLKAGISLPPDSDNLAVERGRTDADRRHRFVLYGETDLPWMGLRASGIVQLASGAPFNVTTGVDDNLDGVLSDRPTGIGRNTGARTNLEAVNSLRQELTRQRPHLNLPPVTHLDEPSFAQVDLRVWKPLSFRGGRAGGELFVQVFNVLDRFNGGLVDGRVISPRFGEPLGRVGPPRTFELGLKLAF